MKRVSLMLVLLFVFAVGLYAEGKTKKSPAEILKAPSLEDSDQEKVVKFIGKKCRSMYIEILGFHSDPSFRYYRFDENGPFIKWFNESIALFNYATEARAKFDVEFDYPDFTVYGCAEQIMKLGAAYNDERGEESFTSLIIKNDIEKMLGIDRYKHEYPVLN